MRLLSLSAFLLAALVARAAPEYPAQGPDIYDPSADAAQQISAALAEAQSTHRRVLLDFGANWCKWCHRLHHTFATAAEVRERLARDYLVVMIDVNTRHGVKRNAAVNEKYGNPIREGLPVLVILDADGRPLVTQETGALEDGEGHDPKKIAAFLDRWAAPKS